jgi:hypothetical protein
MDKQTTSEYMLLFLGTGWHKPLSPEEIQKVMGQWYALMDRLTQQGKLKDAHPLDRFEGKIVSSRKGRRVADGPFAESKEAIGGYFLLQVHDLEEAVEIAKQCPALEHGVDVEVRLVAQECPPYQRVKEALNHATA